MKPRALRLARPLYEGLPWFYVVCGLLALAVSYRQGSTRVSLVAGIFGLLSVLAGVVLVLRRRDFRDMRAHYANQGAKVLPENED